MNCNGFMAGNLFQIWFILFSSIFLFLNQVQPYVAKDLILTALVPSFLFFYIYRAKFKNLSSYLFFLTGVLFITYTSYHGLVILPDSVIPRQKVFFRIYFYIVLTIYFYLHYKEKSRKEILIYSVLVSSNLLIFRQEYSILIICFYILSNLNLLNNITIYKKNYFDVLVFLLFLFSAFSTMKSFYYNGSDSLIGFFYVLTGILIYIFVKYFPDEKKIASVFGFLKINYILTISLFGFFTIYYLIYFQGNPDFTKSISGFHISNLGSVIMIHLGVFFVPLIKKKSILINLFFVFISFFVLYFSHSRSASLGSFVLILFLGIYFFKNLKYKKLILIILLLILLFLVFAFLNISYQADIHKHVSIKERFSIWKIFIERVFHHSILFGFGPNNEKFNLFLPNFYLSEDLISAFKKYTSDFYSPPHAHNYYIQFLFSYGFLGIFLLIFIMAFYFKILFKKLDKEISSEELIAFAIPLSITFQEIFDYTLIDGMSFYPFMISLAVISRNSVNLKSLNFDKNFTKLKSKILNSIVFVFLILISILLFNQFVSEQIKSIFKNQFQIDNFSNLEFTNKEIFDEENLKKFEKLDKLYIPVNLDDEKEQFSGQVFLEYYFKSSNSEFLEKAEKNFLKCIQIFPNSGVCYLKLSEIYKIKNKPDNSETYFSKYKENDPFGLIKKSP